MIPDSSQENFSNFDRMQEEINLETCRSNVRINKKKHCCKKVSLILRKRKVYLTLLTKSLIRWIFTDKKFYCCYFGFSVLFVMIFLLSYERLSFVDALFICTSAASNTGLVTVDFAQFHTFNQVLVMFLIAVNGLILVTILPLIFQYLKLLQNRNILRDSIIYVPASYKPSIRWFSSKKKINPAGIEEDDQADLEQEILVNEFQHKERVLRILISIILLYIIVVLLLGFSILNITGSLSAHQRWIRKQQSVNVTYFASFFSISALFNAGFSLFPDSLIQYDESWVVLVVIGALIVLGNTGFPIMLRLIVSILYLVDSPRKLVYAYLLVHPRTCYSHLFDLHTNIWMFFVLLILNGFQWILTMALLWNSFCMEGLHPGYKVLNALFQSISTRHAGFNSICLSENHSSILLLYVGMMYISAFPVLISVRQSDEREVEKQSRRFNRVRKQLKAVIFKDLLILFTAIFLITLIEGETFFFQTNNVNDRGELIEVASDSKSLRQGPVTIFACCL